MPTAKKPVKAKAKPAAPAKKPAAKKAAAPKRAPKAPPVRAGAVEMGGKPATVIGAEVKVGAKAPAFTAQVGSWTGHDAWQAVDPLAATAGKVRLIAAVPSLDTPVCDLETRRFNTEAVNLGESVCIITISTDLPVAQKRWCGAAGVERVVVVSDHMAADFGLKYGALIKERRLLRRAIFVVDQAGVLRYVAYMPKTSDHPDYDAALAVVKHLLAA
jgi:thioredoxin-dependent peroxiredoxin